MSKTLASRYTFAIATSLLVLGCGASSPSEPPSIGEALGSPTAAGASPLVTDAGPASPPDASQRGTATADRATVRPNVVIPRDSIANVVTDGLLVRTAPRVADDSGKLRPLLSRGNRLYVVDGPTRATGYDWYLVRPLQDGLPIGWVAARDRDGTPWVVHTDLDCPNSPSLDQLARMDRHVALVCYGDRTFRFNGVLTSPMASCGVSWSIEPQWMDDCYAAHNLAANVGQGNPGLDGTPVIEVRLEPALERQAGIPDQPYGMLLPVTVVGGFDNPASASCRAVGSDLSLPPPAIIRHDCRASFVGTSITVRPASSPGA